MTENIKRKFFRMLADERGSQNAKSAVGILFFFTFVFCGALLNSSSLPLSYNIAFGDSGSSGSGGGGVAGGVATPIRQKRKRVSIISASPSITTMAKSKRKRSDWHPTT